MKLNTRYKIAKLKNILGFKLSNEIDSSDYFKKKKKKKKSYSTYDDQVRMFGY